MDDTEYIDHIAHEGVVVRVDRQSGIVTVRLTDDGDCGGCPAAALCSLSGKADKNAVDVVSDRAASFTPGEKVRLVGTERMHRKAILIATVVPCVAMLAVMTVVWLLTDSQAAAALGGIGATIFFFVLLWLMRDRVRHEFRFDIEKKA